MDFQTRFVLCSAPVFLRGRAFLPILPPQTSPQSISRCRASSSYTLHIQSGVCKLVSTNILYSIRYPRSCQAPRIAFKIISDDFSRLLYGSKKRAEPAFTSAEVRHTSKSCSRGRFLRNFLYVKKDRMRFPTNTQNTHPRHRKPLRSNGNIIFQAYRQSAYPRARR